MSRHAVAHIRPSGSNPTPQDVREEWVLPDRLVPPAEVNDVLERLELATEGPASTADDLERRPDPDDVPGADEGLGPQDSVRLYLREIGQIPLLTAREEVEVGRAIERGQERVRRELVAIPLVRSGLVSLFVRLRRQEIESGEFLEAPDGTALAEDR
jgi:hypothetical protein